LIIKILAENEIISEDFKGQHGLSIYIETSKHKLLFDTGANDLFLENAAKLGVNIEDIDIAAISHGHYDHGGGLETFFQNNKKAKVYVQKDALKNYYSKRANGEFKYIGFDESIKESDRFVFVENYLRIDDELELFSNVKGREFFSLANKSLFMEQENEKMEDIFKHEQNLIITEEDKTLLLAGCAHNGIVNIVNKYKEIKGSEPDYVIGGFHLYNRNNKKSEDIETIKGIADFLMKTKSKYYTGHCTGLEAYDQLKSLMGDRIQYIATGSVIKI